MLDEVFEYRGVDSLVYAEVLIDTKNQLVFGSVKPLSPIAEIGRTTENSSEAHYYDNNPMVVVSSVGSDELKLTIAPPNLEIYAEITGQYFDAISGSIVEGERENKYYAIGYRTKGTDGKYRYVWRYKGKFGIPDESTATEDDGTDASNTELTWTGVSTCHVFTKTGKPGKAMITDERYARCDLTTFLANVKTPDTIVGTGSGDNANLKIYVYPTAEEFSNSTNVSIACEDGAANIYYTVDGSTPYAEQIQGSWTYHGTHYTVPFAISDTTVIKAVAFDDEYNSGTVVTKPFRKK